MILGSLEPRDCANFAKLFLRYFSAFNISSFFFSRITNKLLGILDETQARLDKAEALADERIAKIKEALREATESDRKVTGKIMDKLVIFASENRNLIECDGVKTAILTNGSLALRLTPPAVDVEDDEVMIELLKRMGLGRFIRTKEELDRELLLAERKNMPRVPGLSFSQKEKLSVQPVGASEVVKTRKVKL